MKIRKAYKAVQKGKDDVEFFFLCISLYDQNFCAVEGNIQWKDNLM